MKILLTVINSQIGWGLRRTPARRPANSVLSNAKLQSVFGLQ